MMIKDIGNLTSLKKAPLYPEGFDPNVVKVWVPKYEQFVKLQQRMARRVEQDLRLPAVATFSRSGGRRGDGGEEHDTRKD